MVPDPSTREKLALEQRQTLLCEAEHERLLADAQNPLPHLWQRLAGRLGRYLIVLGTRLHRLKQGGRAIEDRIKPSSCANACQMHSALYLFSPDQEESTGCGITSSLARYFRKMQDGTSARSHVDRQQERTIDE